MEFHVVNGVVETCLPGDAPPPTAQQLTEEFLSWLQAQPQFSGNEVRARTLEQLLYPHFVELAGCDLYSWRVISQHLVELPGVKKRQVDRRSACRNHGSSPTVYKIPRRPRR